MEALKRLWAGIKELGRKIIRAFGGGGGPPPVR